METLKYKLIKPERQYNEYCKIHHNLDFSTKKKSKQIVEEIELLTLLIEKYDQQYNDLEMPDPIILLKSLMAHHQMKAVDLGLLLNVGKGLADYFKVAQEAFNRPYKLRVPENALFRNTIVMNTQKNIATA